MTMLGALNSLQNATFVVDRGPLRARIDPPVSECLSHSAMNLKRLGFFVVHCTRLSLGGHMYLLTFLCMSKCGPLGDTPEKWGRV
jgi:hypothetical protein